MLFMLALLASPHSSTSLWVSSFVLALPCTSGHYLSYRGMNKNANDSSGNKWEWNPMHPNFAIEALTTEL